MMIYPEMEEFFTGLVTQAQRRRITCGITSGMACVHFGLSSSTKDCDVLCACESAEKFFDLIAQTLVENRPAAYRGNISPPLDARWLRGGWTTHFAWELASGDSVGLDIFGLAPRATSPWEREIEGIYVSKRIVADMKRTSRGKDWPFVTALGVKMLDAGSLEGWLHLHDAKVIRDNIASLPPPPAIVVRRPVLRLALTGDDRLEAALFAERVHWQSLATCRTRYFERMLRPYVSAVRRATARRNLDLRESHRIRVDCATRALNPDPLRDLGAAKLLEDARAMTAQFVNPALMEWLPDLSERVIYPPR